MWEEPHTGTSADRTANVPVKLPELLPSSRDNHAHRFRPALHISMQFCNGVALVFLAVRVRLWPSVSVDRVVLTVNPSRAAFTDLMMILIPEKINFALSEKLQIMFLRSTNGMITE